MLTVPQIDQVWEPVLGEADQLKRPLAGTAVSYNLWELRDKAVGGRGLEVVVRCRLGGVARQPPHQTVQPSIKLEHQPGLGAELVTASQAVREWTAAVVRPGSTTARVRLTAGKMTMVEELQLGGLAEQCRRLDADPARQLSNLLHLFRSHPLSTHNDVNDVHELIVEKQRFTRTFIPYSLSLSCC